MDQCEYYLHGIVNCRDSILRKYLKNSQTDDSQGFLECKDICMNYFRCTTKDKAGKSLEQADPKAKQFFNNWTKCIFNDLMSAQYCQHLYNDTLFYFIEQDPSLLDLF